jgi:hypothetical protein
VTERPSNRPFASAGLAKEVFFRKMNAVAERRRQTERGTLKAAEIEPTTAISLI